MSKLSSSEISHLAALSRISLTDEEVERLSVDMPKIVEFVEQLNEAKGLTDVVLNCQPMDSLREDVVSGERLTHKDQKQLAPKWTEDQIEVPGVFEE